MRKEPGPVELDPVRWVMPGGFARRGLGKDAQDAAQDERDGE